MKRNKKITKQIKKRRKLFNPKKYKNETKLNQIKNSNLKLKQQFFK